MSLAQTIVFSEDSNSFESFLSYQPEMMCTLGNLLVSFLDGDLYTHDSPVYNNFYGVQYDSYITFSFNDFPLQRKTFLSVQEIANTIWDCPEIVTSLSTYGTTKQTSKLVTANFLPLEGGFNSSFMCDINSTGGWINGDVLKGFFINIQFHTSNTQGLINLAIASIYFINSPLNIR